MEATLISVVIGVIVILFLIRGVGYCFARQAAKNAIRIRRNAEHLNRNARVRVVGASLTINW
jgi:hypothetical protein